MSKATIVVEGFVANDPRTGQHNGDDWVSFSVPHTPRRKNRDTGEWEDAGATLWVQVTLWRDDAARFADHLAKGTLVRVEGEPVLKPWEANGKSGVNLEVKFPQVSVIPARIDRQQPAGAAYGAPQASGDTWGQASGQYDSEAPF